jgi:hypothetical protein
MVGFFNVGAFQILNFTIKAAAAAIFLALPIYLLRIFFYLPIIFKSNIVT